MGLEDQLVLMFFFPFVGDSVNISCTMRVISKVFFMIILKLHNMLNRLNGNASSLKANSYLYKVRKKILPATFIAYRWFGIFFSQEHITYLSR
jgi:hypothetical protein